MFPAGDSTTSQGAMLTLIWRFRVPLERSTTARVLLIERHT